jgi:hypothetical protein
MLSHLSNALFTVRYSTKSNTFLAEPYEQQLLTIFTALSTCYE